ncbi:MAG: glycosyltransferase family 4 protein [Acidaminococcaceae bacterium]
MRVLFTTNIPSPYRVDFFNELGKSCDLTVLYERSDANNRNKEWLLSKATNYKVVFMRGYKVGNDSALCPQIINYLNTKLYDVFIIGGYCTPSGILSIIYLKFKRIPFVLNFDGGFIKKGKTLRHYLKRFLISSASWWISSGRKTNEYLYYYGAKSEKIYNYPFTSIKEEDIINKPIRPDEKKAIRKKLKITEDKIIVAVGRYDYGKGYDVLLNACTKIDNSTGIYIIGGKITQEYAGIKDRLNLKNVHFIDFKTKKELAEYYKAADIFVHPTRRDVWGLVINEAMAYGLPVITTDCCIAGLELVKNDENGYIVPVDDSQVLSEKCSIILRNDDLRKKMSEKSLEIIKEYTIENMAEQHMQIFTKISGVRC